MEDYEASGSIKALCKYISRYYDKKVILLLDEYDTPMQEAYVHGFVLGLLVELADRYVLTSNRESGFGRYDGCLSQEEPGLMAWCWNLRYRRLIRKRICWIRLIRRRIRLSSADMKRSLWRKGFPKIRSVSTALLFAGKKCLLPADNTVYGYKTAKKPRPLLLDTKVVWVFKVCLFLPDIKFRIKSVEVLGIQMFFDDVQPFAEPLEMYDLAFS